MSKRLNTENKPLTKKAFEHLLTKAAQPLPKKESGSKGTGIKGAHPSGGCSGKGMNQDTTEGAEG